MNIALNSNILTIEVFLCPTVDQPGVSVDTLCKRVDVFGPVETQRWSLSALVPPDHGLAKQLFESMTDKLAQRIVSFETPRVSVEILGNEVDTLTALARASAFVKSARPIRCQF